MNSPKSVLLLFCLSVLVFAGTASSTDRILIFDTFFEYSDDIRNLPNVLIQNTDTTYSITINSIKLVWNNVSAMTNPSDGIWIHKSATSCTVLSSTSLSAGQGITVNVATALGQCQSFVECDSQYCTSQEDCGDDCMCVGQLTPPYGSYGLCVPNFGSQIPIPSRVTVVVDYTKGSAVDPTIRGVDYLIDRSTPELLGASAAAE